MRVLSQDRLDAQGLDSPGLPIGTGFRLDLLDQLRRRCRAFREEVYVRAAELPPQLANDPKLRIEAVEAAPAGVVVIELKPERVQHPTPAVAAAPPTRKRA